MTLLFDQCKICKWIDRKICLIYGKFIENSLVKSTLSHLMMILLHFFNGWWKLFAIRNSMKFCLAPTMLNSKTEKTRAKKAVNGAVASAAVYVWVCTVYACVRLCYTWDVTFSYVKCDSTQCESQIVLMQTILDSFSKLIDNEFYLKKKKLLQFSLFILPLIFGIIVLWNTFAMNSGERAPPSNFFIFPHLHKKLRNNFDKTFILI